MKIVLISFLFYISNAHGNVILKNRLEILESISSIVNVSKYNKNAREVYDLHSSSLTKYGYINELNESMLVGLFSVSYAFCNEAYVKEVKIAPSARQLYFKQPIGKKFQSLRDSELESLLQNFSLQIYNRTLQQSELVELKLAAKDLLRGKSELGYSSLCAMFFTSVDFLVN